MWLQCVLYRNSARKAINSFVSVVVSKQSVKYTIKMEDVFSESLHIYSKLSKCESRDIDLRPSVKIEVLGVT